MLTAKPVRTEMIAYHYAMNERRYQQRAFLDTATCVREDDYSIGSLRNHMVHLLSVDVAWLNGLWGIRVNSWHGCIRSMRVCGEPSREYEYVVLVCIEQNASLHDIALCRVTKTNCGVVHRMHVYKICMNCMR